MTPSLEECPTKAKGIPSFHEVRHAPLDTNPLFQCLGALMILSTALVILKANKLLECLTKNFWQKTNQKEFRVEKVIKRKGDKLY